jgi:hypothetical protein|tara:strand:- start:1861 stop:2541 length:681 start_codon:yes stop_codon:yes gene_type:complete
MKLHLQVPDTLADITLKQYADFDKVNIEENQNSIFLMQKVVEIFCKVNLDLTLQIKFKDLQDITKHIYKMLEQETEFVSVFKMNDIEYGFIPKLDDITLGEYIDLDNYLGSWKTMNKAMAVLYRPVEYRKGERYIIEEYKGTEGSEIMYDAPLNIPLGAMIFFWNLKTELLSLTLNYSQKVLGENLTLEQQQTLEKNGVGINQSLHSLQEILKDLKISQNSKQQNV